MYRKTIEQTCNELGTDIKSGLTCAEVAARRERDGLNEIEGGKREPFILKLARQFADVLIIILLVAAAVSLIVDPSEWVDSLVILIVVAINAVLGVVQESRAEKSLDALKKMSAPSCKVIRDGKTDIIPSSELVRGDVISVEAATISPQTPVSSRRQFAGGRIRAHRRIASGKQEYRAYRWRDDRARRP